MSLEKIEVCPVCQSRSLKFYLCCQDYTVSQELFNLEQCETCQFIFTNPRPDEQSIGKYYQSDAYISHSNTRNGLIAQGYHFVRHIALRQKLSLINSVSPERGTLLDIGCGTGLFASVSQKKGWRVIGVEPDAVARKQAEANLNQPVFEKIGDVQSPTPIQVITLWHVLEHIHQLNKTVKWIATHLAKEGKLVVAVPNHQSEDAQWYGPHWAAYDVPRHLYHFSPQTLPTLMASHGFKLRATHPMPFDAYYVSLLSSKYKTGQVNYAEALWKGFISNRKASRTGQYSSLIYVFEKQPKRHPYH